MKTKWTGHLKSVEEKERFRQQVMSSKGVLDRLADIMRDDIEATLAEMSRSDSYTSPAWSEYQADRLGTLKTLRKYVDLLNLDGRK